MMPSIKLVFVIAMLTESSLFGAAFQPQFNKNRLFSGLLSSTPIDQDSTQLLDPRSVNQRVFDEDKRPVILFDGVCNMCNDAVNLALDWDPKGRLRFSALQSNVGRSLLEANDRKPDDISSIVLVTKDGAYVKSDAVLKITEELMPFSLLPLKPAAVLGRYIVPKFLRDIIYDGVADNRYSIMGKRDQCRFDSDGEFEDRFVDDQIAALR
jgi:predicted DCC family thiol-disulfide oxidoreductase YuxK